MANTVIALKKSGTSSAVPSSLANGEIAINYADGVIFYKHANGTIASFSGGGGGSNFGTVNAGGTLLVSDTAGDVLDIRAGQNIIITGDAINDRMTINADLTAANSWANAVGVAANAYALSISGGSSVNVSTVGPTNNTNGSLWWNTDLGRLFIWYTDGDSNQWVEASPASGSVDVALLQSYSNATNIYVTSLTSAGLASANAWSNTKLANSSGTFAGALTTTGQVTANGQINITPAGGEEGGEIQLQATGGNTNWSIDAYQNNFRIFARSGLTVSNVNMFHATGGSIRLGVNKSDPLYTLDVAGTANATLVLDSKGDVRDIPLNTQASPYALSLNDTGKVISTTTNVFVPNGIFSSGHTISVFNSSAVTINIIANSGVTFRLAGASNNQNKLLAQNGVATIICVAANNFVLSGAGLS